MPRVDTRSLTQDPSVMANIQAEVAEESRPLLLFITKNAKFLVGFIVLLIIALAVTAIYRYVENSQRDETLDAVARIMARPADAQQLRDLQVLVETTPESMRTAVAVAMAESAMRQNNAPKAAEAYGMVARAEYDSPMGLSSAVSQAGWLLRQGKYAEGLEILKSIEPRLTTQAGQQIRVMLAEAAYRAGDRELAASTYEKVAAVAASDLDREYYANRAREMRAASAGSE